MEPLKELLIGYCDQRQLAISDRPIGETGLTPRIAWIARLWGISVGLRRRHLWRFGQTHFPEVFGTYVGATDQSWLTEVLRIMDRPRSNVRGQKLENLTVQLCHERFQSDPSVTLEDKREERKRYNALVAAYEAAKLRDFRNLQMFHLDLATALASPDKTGNVLSLTGLLVNWVDHVYRTAFGDEPRSVTHGCQQGKKAAREFRQMLVARLRELVGKPRPNKKRFKSPGWNALCACIVNSYNSESSC
jgi:hypothetical protein